MIDTPTVGLTWKVGDTISFSGHATDEEDGTIPASGLLWDVIMQHCPSACHEHLVQSFDGVATGSFPAPDHEYPSYLQLRLTATDSHGVRTTVTRDLMPQTVQLTLAANPVLSPGLTLGFNLDTSAPAPYTKTVILGSNNTLIAPSQSRGSTQYNFQSWSNGGSATQDIVANASATYTATFIGTVIPWTSQAIGATLAGTWSEAGGVHTITGAGTDIWGTSDQFRFTHQQITGDATITARVTELVDNAGGTQNAFAKAGVMFRQTLNANSINVHALVSPVASSKFRFIRRLTTGGSSTVDATLPDSPLPGAPGWVRAVRSGNTFTGYYSLNGTTLTQLGTAQTIAMGATVYVGLAVTSHDDGRWPGAGSTTSPSPPRRPPPRPRRRPACKPPPATPRWR